MHEPRIALIDREEAAEMARLLERDRLFIEAIGGLFPECHPGTLQQEQRVLDLACGPGSWLVQVAVNHPDWELIGIDPSPSMIDYARTQAQVQHLDLVSFLVMDGRAPLPFPANSFDLITGRQLVSLLDQEHWPKLLAECQRLLRPGGLLWLTELETWQTNSQAGQHLWNYLCIALRMQERTFALGPAGLGIAPLLSRLLRQAGLEQRGEQAFCINASAGEPLCPLACRQAQIAFHLLKPYLVQSGLLTEAEFETLHQQMTIDMYGENFVSLAFGLTASGSKPHSGEEAAESACK